MSRKLLWPKKVEYVGSVGKNYMVIFAIAKFWKLLRIGTWMLSIQEMHAELQWGNLMEEQDGRIRQK